MALNVLTLPINLYINYVVMPVKVDNNTCSVCFISHTRDGSSTSMLKVVKLGSCPIFLPVELGSFI